MPGDKSLDNSYLVLQRQDFTMNGIKEKDLREKIRKALSKVISEEDIKNYNPQNMGIYDQPIGSFEPDEDQPESPKTEEEYPVGPSPDAQMQLSQQKPDIENPEYVPANTKELQRALHALGEKIPESQIRDTYRQMSKLVIAAIDKDYDQQSQIKEIANLPHSIRKGPPEPGTATLQQTADATGMGSVAKAAQFENRLLKKMRALLVTSKGPEIQALIDASVEAYIDVMREAGNMTDEDIAYFKENPQRMEMLKKSDLFRSFLGNAILQQGMRRIRLDTEKALKDEIGKLDIPKGADLTILNHVMGNTNMTYQKFINLVGQKAESDNFGVDKMYRLSKKMPKVLEDLRSLIEDLSNTKLIPLAVKEWISSSKAKKTKLLMKAAQDVASLHDAENSI